MGMEKVGTLRWDGAVAQARMDNLLSANYSDGSRVDAVLAPYDGLSRGIISSLRGVGYGTADQPWPIISGQDAETPSVKAIIAGEQYSTVFKDTRELAKVTAELVDAVLSGGTPEINDEKTYNNGVKVVPSYLLDAGVGRQVELRGNRGRLRLHQGRRPAVITVHDRGEPGGLPAIFFAGPVRRTVELGSLESDCPAQFHPTKRTAFGICNASIRV